MLLLSYSSGQRSHRPTQVQGKGMETPKLLVDGVSKDLGLFFKTAIIFQFFSINNLLWIFSKFNFLLRDL